MGSERPQEQPGEELSQKKTEDLAYSLEVKLMNCDMRWFINQSMASPAMSYIDPVKNMEAREIIQEIMRRLPSMTTHDLENLKASFSSGPLRFANELDDERQADLAETYEDLGKKNPEELTRKKKITEQVMAINRGIQAILETIARLTKRKQESPVEGSTQTTHGKIEQLELFKKE